MRREEKILPAAGTKPSPFDGVRVLIADDDKAFAGTLAELLQTGGHEVVEIVHSGLDAIRSYRRHKPDVVLMDFAMGRLNGLTACRNILSEDRAGCILFLSALSDHRDLAPTFSGARAVLQKPIGFAMLERVLHDVAAQRFSEEAVKAESGAAPCLCAEAG